MKRIQLNKAQGYSNTKPVESVILEFTVQINEFDSLDKACVYYESQANQIEEALHDVLPGGVYDRLLAAMMTRRASYLRTPFGSEG